MKWQFLVLLLFLTSCTLEKSLEAAIEEANYCDVANDCIDIGSKCPFGCNILVNEEKAEGLRQQINTYHSNCVYSCVAIQGIDCVENKCVIIE